jgi:hypothetical protein
MRMWNVNPEILCKQHLLGEHAEMHMFVGTIRKGISIGGYLDNGLVNPGQIKARHDRLVTEMNRRGMNHKSPIDAEPLPGDPRISVDVNANIHELSRRCPKCHAYQVIAERKKDKP